ncbi:MAG: diguanylate cyclase domain with sensor [Myxococcaceae bacterium]|nr:diguanylate cyclase domain with sensor [Myxococcaceae bacterium]
MRHDADTRTERGALGTRGRPPLPGAALNSVGKKLLLSIALPTLALALVALGFLWQRTDQAVRQATHDEAVRMAELVAGNFSLADASDARQKGGPRVVHRAVTQTMRSGWASKANVSSLRILDRYDVVRWSRKVEEEDKPLTAVPREVTKGTEVVLPLGGVACAGCHVGESTMRAGMLQLIVEDASLQQSVAGGFIQALLILLLFSVALVGATAVSLRIFLTSPLQKLTAAMKRAEEGDFVARAEERTHDEIGRLARAFNRMLVRITSLKAEEIDNRRDLDHARGELELKGQLEGRLKELSILYDVARAVTSSIELNEVLQKITDTVPTRLNVPKFSIMLLGKSGLEVRKSHPAGSEGLSFAVGEGICGHAAATRKSVYVAELEKDQQLFRIRGGAGAKGRGSLLALPMVHGEDLLGVLNFERPETAGFSAAEIEFFTAVADQAAMAVKNARLHEQTVELSITDPLTGVSNRRHLFAQLELEIARANRFGTQLSFLMIDIDYFKKLNDAAGHTAGDGVLRHVCELMQGSVRRVDTLARYGGEEFVVLLPQVTRAEALEVADKLRQLVEQAPIAHREVQPGGKVTISVGVANLPIDAVEQGQLVDCADAALYASKRSGRNRVTTYAAGMEMHPGRERGPNAQKRRITAEIPVVAVAGGSTKP